MSFYTSLSGLRAAQTDLSVTSNNIANVGSVGFKKSRAEFGDLMPPSSSSAGIGTRLKGITQQFTQGQFENSSRELDLAINGTGFFITRDQGGAGDTMFTRDGALTINADRWLTDSRGANLQAFPVDAAGAATSTDLASAISIQVPEASATSGARLSDLSIDPEGLITASFSDGSTQPLGRVAIANFSNPAGLRQQGDGRWSVTGESGTAVTGTPKSDGFGAVQSGAIERANVDLTEELVALIAAQRNFQANAKAIETANALTQTVTNLRS
ncbi:MAG TPA: flagellar hook-basal body complex protein [Allosphingosinicella sp.]|jgi:flagellar hook protein FlgE